MGSYVITHNQENVPIAGVFLITVGRIPFKIHAPWGYSLFLLSLSLQACQKDTSNEAIPEQGYYGDDPRLPKPETIVTKM